MRGPCNAAQDHKTLAPLHGKIVICLLIDYEERKYELKLAYTESVSPIWPLRPSLSTSSLLDELPERRPMTVILVSGAWRQFCYATA